MDNQSSKYYEDIKVARWIARILSLLFILTTMFFFLAEEVFSGHLRTASLPLIPLILGALMLIGFIIAWKWEFPGGLISLVCFIGIAVYNPTVWTKALMYIVPFTSILFMFSSFGNRSRQQIKQKLNDKSS